MKNKLNKLNKLKCFFKYFLFKIYFQSHEDALNNFLDQYDFQNLNNGLNQSVLSRYFGNYLSKILLDKIVEGTTLHSSCSSFLSYLKNTNLDHDIKFLILYRYYLLLVLHGRYLNASIVRKEMIVHTLNFGDELSKSRIFNELSMYFENNESNNNHYYKINVAYNELLLNKINLSDYSLKVSFSNSSGSLDGKSFYVIGPIGRPAINNISDDTVIVFIKPPEFEILKQKVNNKIIVYFNSQHTLNGTLESYRRKCNSDNILLFSKSTSNFSDKKFNKNCLIPFGGPMMLQNILFDLLYYNPSNITISCFNFYCSEVFYNSSYLVENKSIISDKISRRKTFAFHDLESNFLFVKNLYSRNLIKVDSENTRNVLDLTVEEYMSHLEKFH